MGITVLTGSGISSQAQMHQSVFAAAKKEPKVPYLYLVPEQTTLQTERELVEAHPDHVLGNIRVISFSGMAREVMKELELPMNGMLDDVGKAMILRRIGEEKKKELQFFHGNFSQKGFTEKMKASVDELAMSGIRSDRLDQVLAGAEKSPLLKRKLEDIFVIYREFTAELGEKYMTAEELLHMLAVHAPESERLKGCRIFLYGFTSFRNYQLEVLETLALRAKSLTVLLTIGSSEDPDLFPMADKTRRIFCRMAEKYGIPFGEKRTEKVSAGFPKDFSHLERYLFACPAERYEEEPKAVRLIRAKDPLREAEYVVREILRLVREKGLRFSQIAVIAGDLSIYGTLLADRFEDYGIPYFLDEKRDFSKDPLAEFTSEILEVMEENFSYESVIPLLRNPLWPMDPEDADLIDNYLVASGIAGRKRWADTWSFSYGGMQPERLKRINDLRQSVYDLLTPLWDVWKEKKGVNVEAAAAALVHFLEFVGAQKKMEEWAEAFEKAGDPIRFSEYSQAYRKIMDLLDQIVSLMGKEELRPKLLIDTLQGGIESLKVGHIPATFDRVVIGDLVRTRLPRVKALYLIGANDKILPKEGEQGGILTDFDREILKSEGVELLPTVRDEGFIQQEYLYLMMTKATESLTVLFAETSREKKEIHPSCVVSELQRLFPRLSVKDARLEYAGNAAAATAEDGFGLMIAGLRDFLDTPRDFGPKKETSEEDTEREKSENGGFEQEELEKEKSGQDGSGQNPSGKEESGNSHKDSDREDETWWKELYSYFSGREEYRKRLEYVKEGLFFSPHTEKLDEEIARRLFGADRENNITRLESYSSCAFAHFLAYGLKLQPRAEHCLKASDYGTIFHQTIRCFFEKMKEKKLDWRKLTPEERQELTKASVDRAIEGYQSTIFESSARNRYALKRINRIADRAMQVLGAQWKEGDYQEILWEYSFKNKNAIQLPIKEGLILALSGRVDRIDLRVTDGKVFVKIIDYKSGNTEFDLNRVSNGLQLQLLLYLEAALAMEKKKYPEKEIIPAGIYYYNLKDPFVEAVSEEDGAGNGKDPEELRMQALRMNGLTNSMEEAVDSIGPRPENVVKGLKRNKDGSLGKKAPTASSTQFAGLQKYIRRKAAEIGRSMYEGEIAADPYEYGQQTSCQFCDYREACDFDIRDGLCRYRRMEKQGRQDIFQQVEEENRKAEEDSACQK